MEMVILADQKKAGYLNLLALYKLPSPLPSPHLSKQGHRSFHKTVLDSPPFEVFPPKWSVFFPPNLMLIQTFAPSWLP